MDCWSGQFRPRKICLDLVYYLGRGVGRIIYHLWNFPIITTTILVFVVLHMRLSMGESADHHFVGMQWVRRLFWGQIGFSKPLS